MTTVASVLAPILGAMYLDARLSLGRDLRLMRVKRTVLQKGKALEQQDRVHFYFQFKEKAKENPERVLVLFEGRSYTISHIEKDVASTDVVCMMHPNHPTFYVIFLAILKTGAIPALINANLTEEALLHCVKTADCKLFVFDPSYADRIAAIAEPIVNRGIALFAYGEATEESEISISLAPALTPNYLSAYGTQDTSEEYLKGTNGTDTACLIYTSTAALVSGGTIVLSRKFSASRFWDDCAQYKVTVVVYIGEICRYLLNQPSHPQEHNHQIRFFYGPIALFNICKNAFGAGSVGHYGWLMRKLNKGVRLIQIDPASEEPIRKNGFCIECKVGEPGEFVVRLDPTIPHQFQGYYKNEKATQSKTLHDVFIKGDKYFRSGDILTMDSDGFFYFGDRVGDTFRWKAENVATTEVAAVIGAFPGIEEVIVYGTLAPLHDGRAGMAAITLRPNTTLDFKKLYHYLTQKLPRYAIPLFIRIVDRIEVTVTFKHVKSLYRNQGIDLTKTPSDQTVYWVRGDTYVPFTPKDYDQIQSGKIKL
ncbi:hypothetical protein DFQ28_010796 [Apophysomyces sp. BC1034]|nr:hypothetical protein DFQ28_010796 [Apophysomyces sp. BC1034]